MVKHSLFWNKFLDSLAVTVVLDVPHSPQPLDPVVVFLVDEFKTSLSGSVIASI
mgnify:CR=1 FL=1